MILGQGFTINSATYFGDSRSSATYQDGDTTNPGVLPGDTGVILSTGRVSNFANGSGANNQSGSTSTNTSGVNGDADFNTAAGTSTFDASYLEINFTPEPGQTTLSIEFRFYSEEYNEYVYSNFNDIALVMLNGTVQPISVGSGEISVNSINNAAVTPPSNGSQANDPNPGNGQFDSANPNLYVDNTGGAFATEMDGFTVTLSLDIPVTPGVAQTLKIGIADVGDSSWDSSLVIAANTQVGAIDNDPIAVDDTTTLFGGSPRTVNVLANDSDPNGQTLTITQINGVDVVAGDTVSLNSGETITLNANGTITLNDGGAPSGSQSFSYTVADTDGNTDSAFVSFTTVPACYLPGSLVATPHGERAIETLKAGDWVLTRDAGPQVIRWVGLRDVDLLADTGGLQMHPVRIRAGAFGPDFPSRDLLVSPRHRILVKSVSAELMLGQREVLVAAAHLVNGASVAVDTSPSRVRYHHLLLDDHHVLKVNGLEAESLYAGRMALEGFTAAARESLFGQFPDLREGGAALGPPARYVARRHEARLIVA
jgi:hypothetical protein